MPEQDDLEILEDMRFQTRDWTRERVGWAVMALVVVAGLVGVFGHGHVSYRTASERDGFEVGYERVARRGGITGLHLRVAPEAVAENGIEVVVSTGLLRHVLVESIVPEPTSVSLAGGGVRYAFELGGSPPTDEVVIRFDVRPDSIGRIGGDVELVEHSTVRVDQFLLP